jgi:FkbM family methyltransferase
MSRSAFDMKLRYSDYVFESPGINVGGFYSIFYLGSYDPILERLQRDDIVIDGGANIGVFSIIAARTAKRVFAIEPHPVNFAYLCRNIELNGATNVIPMQCALGSRDGPGFLEGEGELSHLSDQGRAVAIKTIDNVTKEKVTVIKLDIEGAEIMALTGQVSLDWVRLIAAELDRPSLERINADPSINRGVVGSFEDLISELRSKGFRIQFQNEASVNPYHKLTERHVLGNELKTRFFGTRVVLSALLHKKNLLRPKTWTDDSHFFWMVYGFRSGNQAD